MYALVEIKGKQFRAEEGAVLKIDKIVAAEGEVVEYDSVLLLRSDDAVTLGTPYVSGARVKAVVEGHGRGEKITVYKYKRRKNYARKQGHRQSYSLIRVKEIAAT